LRIMRRKGLMRTHGCESGSRKNEHELCSTIRMLLRVHPALRAKHLKYGCSTLGRPFTRRTTTNRRKQIVRAKFLGVRQKTSSRDDAAY